MNPTKERDLAAWIIAEGLRGTAELQLLAGFCDRLVEAGIPLLRANINKRTLHPLVFGSDFEWWRDEGIRQDDWYHGTTRPSEEELRRFPFYYMSAEGLSRLRRRLDKPVADFPLLERLRLRGGTDYVANRRNPAAQTLDLRAQNHHQPCKSATPQPATSASNIRDLPPNISVTCAIQNP